MEVISSIYEIQELSQRFEKDGKKIGLVPTMGYLHEGHLSLVDLVRKRSDVIFLSILLIPLNLG